jgi:hypothetical protein
MKREGSPSTVGIAVCFLMMFGTGVAQEERTLTEVSWEEVAEAGRLTSGQTVVDEATGKQVLMVSHGGGGRGVFPLTEIVAPGVTKRHYAVRGGVRYEGVGGTGFLEMWSYFPDGSGYFSRTLDTGGAMQMISGDSEWREFVLPFDRGSDPQPAKPDRLVINLVLPDSGAVWISDLELIELDGSPNLYTGAWWNGRTGGMVGGGIGGLLGLLLALAGTLIGFGRGRHVVNVILAGTTGVGALCLITGFVALADEQPYPVTYPLFLIGVLALSFGIGGLLLARLSYRHRELRRMQALDA